MKTKKILLALWAGLILLGVSFASVLIDRVPISDKAYAELSTQAAADKVTVEAKIGNMIDGTIEGNERAKERQEFEKLLLKVRGSRAYQKQTIDYWKNTLDIATE